MATKGASWTPIEPEQPDDEAGGVHAATLGVDGLADARVEELVVASMPDAAVMRVEVARLVAAKATLPGLMVRDAAFAGGDLSNAVLAGARLRRVSVSGLGGVGVDASDAHLEDVVLRGCKLKVSHAFGTRMTRCAFESCDLRDADFEGAALDRVVFRDCDLSGVRLVGVDLARCDLRGSRVDGLVVSPDRIRGIRVDALQLPTFAAALGLDVGEAPRG